MTTTHFIRTDNFLIMDFNQLKSQPEFTPLLYQWPSSVYSSSVDTVIGNHNAPIVRIHETDEPAVALWEVSVRPESPDPLYSYDSLEDKYYRLWTKRNLTQQELDDLNEQKKIDNDAMRGYRYQTESDPLFFKSQRGETPSGEWLEKIEQIRSELPDPVIIAIPE